MVIGGEITEMVDFIILISSSVNDFRRTHQVAFTAHEVYTSSMHIA